jgi:hypothetical protein
MSHPLRRIKPAPQWPSYTGTSHYVGTSSATQVAVYLDPSLGDPALQNARDLVADADRVVKANNAIFGTPSEAVDVIIFAVGGMTDGSGGADHNACDYTSGAAIEVCASFGNSARVSALFEAELSECSMGGNLCGVSTGEALSRWCAAVVSNNALADFATAPAWAKKGMPDFVDKTDGTDQNEVSTGCGMAFLSWLQKLGFNLNRIAPSMVKLGTAGTLAQLYSTLTSSPQSDAWPTFNAAVRALPPITNDDPFSTTTGRGSHVTGRKRPQVPTATAKARMKPTRHPSRRR